MVERRIAHLGLEVELDATPIAGSVRGAGAEDRRFSGWIELTRNIEQSLDTARSHREPDAEPDAEPPGDPQMEARP